MSGQSEINTLLRKAETQGFTLRPMASGHTSIFLDGEFVTMAAASSSDSRAHHQISAALKRFGFDKNYGTKGHKANTATLSTTTKETAPVTTVTFSDNLAAIDQINANLRELNEAAKVEAGRRKPHAPLSFVTNLDDVKTCSSCQNSFNKSDIRGRTKMCRLCYNAYMKSYMHKKAGKGIETPEESQPAVEVPETTEVTETPEEAQPVVETPEAVTKTETVVAEAELPLDNGFLKSASAILALAAKSTDDLNRRRLITIAEGYIAASKIQ